MADGSPRRALVRHHPPAAGLSGPNSGGVADSRHTAHGSGPSDDTSARRADLSPPPCPPVFETRRLVAVVRRAVPLLRYLKRFIYPRWTTPFEATRRLVGGVVLLLSFTLFVPVPLSNILPAVFISLVAFAYLEEDGALLSLALIAALVLLAVIIPGAIWGLTTL
jgi:hypothetical protein